ncbi:MAG: T9SS type A sorting domain-containing protein [Bacteroidota bacterium]
MDSLQWANPIDWASANQLLQYLSGISAISPSPDAYEGNLALQLESVEFMINCDTDSFGFMVDGSWEGFEEPSSGIPFTPSQANFCFGGFYRYLPQGSDTAAAALLFTRFDPVTQTRDTLHEEGMALPAAEAYTRFEFCLDTVDWDVQPDSFIVAFLSSDADHFFSDATPGIGSRLLLDALYFQDEPSTGVASHPLPMEVLLYPNPVMDQLSLQSKASVSQPLLIEIHDLQGKRIFQQHCEQPIIQISVGHIAPGPYLIRVSDPQTGAFLNQKMIKR